MKLSKIVFLLISAIFIFTSFHLAYDYVQEVSAKVPTKGGTIVEGVLGKLNYLPYTSTNSTDEFYQRLLFSACVRSKPNGTGTIAFEDDICEVTTNDYKNYFVRINKKLAWLDNKPFTLDDVEFTYQTILKENIWKIPTLNVYGKTEITKQDNALKVTFPKQSVDNILFFTNSILPKHVLEDQTMEFYLKTFAKQPIYISCAILDLVKSHNNNYIFDVTECSQYYPKILQVKSFADETESVTYLQNKDTIVDFIATDVGKGEVFSSIKPYFQDQSIPTNTLYTLFFNINTVGEGLRKALTNQLSQLNYDNLIHNNQNIFSLQNNDTGIILKNIISNQSVISGSSAGTLNVAFPFLPKNIWIFGKNKFKEYYLDEQRDKYLVEFKFDAKYDKITISANWSPEYTPDTYDVENNSCGYNFSVQYKNIQKWVNNYIVYWYLDGVKNKLLSMKVHYGVKPQTSTLNTKKTNYTIIYLDEPNSQKIVNNLKQYFTDQGIDNFITRTYYNSIQEFEGKLSSKGYDMALLPLELGLKSDLSALFSDNILLNPSQYTNDRVSQLLQKYTNGNKSNIDEIMSIYKKMYSFVVIGSLTQNLYINAEYKDKIKPDETLILSNETIFDRNNFSSFMQSKF